ncbi:hypothetical protein ACIOJF_01970 [Glutamicibacter sp. NPDC087831]
MLEFEQVVYLSAINSNSKILLAEIGAFSAGIMLPSATRIFPT